MFRSRTKDSDCSASFADSEPISTSCLREKKLILRPFVRRKRTPNRTFAMPELDHRFGDRHRISCSSENWCLSSNYHSNLRAKYPVSMNVKTVLSAGSGRSSEIALNIDSS